MTAIVPARVNGAYAPPDLVEMPMASMGCRPLPTTVSASPRQPHVPCHGSSNKATSLASSTTATRTTTLSTIGKKGQAYRPSREPPHLSALGRAKGGVKVKAMSHRREFAVLGYCTVARPGFSAADLAN